VTSHQIAHDLSFYLFIYLVIILARFGTFKALIAIKTFFDVTPYILVDIYKGFQKISYLPLTLFA
jgi:hypothetical protein